ncbi:MAG: YbaN family protein [Tissierellia bacterium]|nr:YbaN family protein [Tissierellia bacterium]
MKYLFVFLAFIFLGLGIIGIYLPILPTTPFLLLSAACFTRGSEKFNNWFINTKIYKLNIEPIFEKRGMPMKRKIKILAMITLLFSIGLIFMKNIYIKALLMIILLIHYYFIVVKIKTNEEEI